MRVVALEEHYTVPGLVRRIDPAAVRRRGFPGPDFVWGQVIKRNELANVADARLSDMDASGITVQVLSVAGPGADVVPGAEGITLARDYNNALAEAATRHPRAVDRGVRAGNLDQQIDGRHRDLEVIAHGRV